VFNVFYSWGQRVLHLWNNVPYYRTDELWVLGQNGRGQNGMDKMVWTKWYGQNGIEQNGAEKMVRMKWCTD